MKPYLLLLFLVIAFGDVAKGQSTIAKLKYEDAEELHTRGDDAAALKKLDHAKQILGSTNPKILYPRIMEESHIVTTSQPDFATVAEPRK